LGVVTAAAVLLAAGLAGAQTGAPTATPTDFLAAALQLSNVSQVEVSLPGTEVDAALMQFGARVRTCARDAVSSGFIAQ